MFARIYQGGTSALAGVQLHWTLRNESDQVVMNLEDDIKPDRFVSTTRATDVSVEVPAGLPAGAYLLTVEAIGEKTTARRESRFTLSK